MNMAVSWEMRLALSLVKRAAVLSEHLDTLLEVQAAAVGPVIP